jgi:hypothetical protein
MTPAELANGGCGPVQHGTRIPLVDAERPRRSQWRRCSEMAPGAQFVALIPSVARYDPHT